MKISFAQRLNLFLLVLFGFMICTATSAMARPQNYGGGMEDEYGMGDMMGGMTNTPAPTPLQTAIKSLKQTTDKAKRAKIQTKINELLSQQYDSYLKQNESELDKMEKRLKNLRNQLERRRSAKELLVELELKRIVNEADGLAWPANPAGSSFGGDDYSDYGGGGGYDEGGDLLGGLLGGDSYEAMGGTPSRSSVGKTKNREQLLQEMIAAQKGWPIAEEKDEVNQKNDVATAKSAISQSGIACLNYESANFRFPSNIIGPDGKALLSWRVAILPFLGNDGIRLYKKFHLYEPWYSEHNKTLLNEIPKVFKNIGEDGSKTSILGFEMEGAVFENDKQLTFANISDGSSSTILAINAADDLAVEWTKPADISLGDYKSRQPKQLFRDSEVNVVLCDCSTHRIRKDVDAKDLQNLILRNDGQIKGGETVDYKTVFEE